MSYVYIHWIIFEHNLTALHELFETTGLKEKGDQLYFGPKKNSFLG